MIQPCAKTAAENTLSFVGIRLLLTYTHAKSTIVSATGVGLEIRTSPDRVAFTFVGLVWPNGASWTDRQSQSF